MAAEAKEGVVAKAEAAKAAVLDAYGLAQRFLPGLVTAGKAVDLTTDGGSPLSCCLMRSARLAAT